MSPDDHWLVILRNDSHIRRHVKHLTLLSQHLIFALQVVIYHCPAETELRWLRFTSVSHPGQCNYKIPLILPLHLRRVDNIALLTEEQVNETSKSIAKRSGKWQKNQKTKTVVWSQRTCFSTLIQIIYACDCLASRSRVLCQCIFFCSILFITQVMQRSKIFRWNKHIR